MSAFFSDSIVPWLLGTLLLLMVLTSAITIKSWRDLKSSPYFFLRRQAEKKLQSYLMASMALMMITAVTSAFAWQEPADSTPRVAILANAKPPREDIVALFRESSIGDTTAVTDSPLFTETTPALILAAVETEADQTLPDQFDRFEPTAELKQDTDLGALAFSTEISERYQALNPASIFAEGFYTLYATFDYAEMANGMEWAWVWRLNGDVIDGGNELWDYGGNGPGYIYFSPEEGFQNGEYSLQVWVNGEMLAQSEVVMNNAAFAAGN